MDKITTFSGLCMPLRMDDVDTDLIIPAQYLTSISTSGYGDNLFKRLRENPDFVYNQSQYHGSEIIITQKNFGCGSSREHAVWAIKQAGFKMIIAESFSDIFYNNSGKNGLLLVSLPEKEVNHLLDLAKEAHLTLSVNLAAQTISLTNGDSIHFDIDPFRKHCFLNGLDDLAYLQSKKETVVKYFKTREPYYFVRA